MKYYFSLVGATILLLSFYHYFRYPVWDEIPILITIGILTNSTVFGFFCSFIAKEKRRDKDKWFLLGSVFSIVALLALIAVPKKES